MNAPEKCPKCWAEFKDTEDLVVVYECGTECFTSDGRIYFRSIECNERVLIQRDALLARVKRMEEELGHLIRLYEARCQQEQQTGDAVLIASRRATLSAFEAVRKMIRDIKQTTQ